LQVLASFTILASISISIFFSNWKADLLIAVFVTIVVGLYMFFWRKYERKGTTKDVQ
jgi:membrane protein implicated in regulation of membrane protease activity